MSVCLSLSGLPAFAQLSITTPGSSTTVTFDGSLSGVSNGSFQGSGFTSTPASGQLDSEGWEVTGLSDGDLNFGGTGTSGDFARGTSTGGETTGGIYAFEMGSGDFALGVQPGGSDMTPGTITLKVDNNSGQNIGEVELSYDINVYNDQNRANSFDFEWSYDNMDYYPVATLDYTSPETADVTPSWVTVARSTTLRVYLEAGNSIYLRWTTNDVSGSGSRDEFALDNISVEFNGDFQLPIITELMINAHMDESGNPYGGTEYPAEWIEFYNPNAIPFNLQGITISDNAGSHRITDEVLIPSTDFAVIGGSCDQSQNGDYSGCGYAYGSAIQLANGGDIVELTSAVGTTLDRVDFQSGWTIPQGASLIFTGTQNDDNNDPSYWLASGQRESNFSAGSPSSDYGSPGTAGGSQLLAINALFLQAHLEVDGVQLTWESDDPLADKRMNLYHSVNGSDAVLLQSGLSVADSYLHGSPSTGLNYYWLEWQEGGATQQSDIVKAFWNGHDGFSLNPNPVSDRLYIASGEVQGDLEVLNAYGQRVYQIPLDETGTAIQLAVADLASGWYFVRIIHAGEQVASHSFFKQ